MPLATEQLDCLPGRQYIDTLNQPAIPIKGVDSDEAVKVAAEVMKSKSAEGRKPEGSGGQAASPQKLSSVNGSQVYLPRRNDLGIQSVVR